MTPAPALTLYEQAQRVLEGYEALLASPAFEHRVDLAVLTKLATDEKVPERERRRAAEVLLTMRVRLMEAMATLLGVREQTLQSLGIAQGQVPQNLTQINQRIEIVRAGDWRGAPALEDAGVDALPPGAGDG